MTRYEVSTWYEWYGDFHLDDVAFQAVGRPADETGCGLGERDLAWNCTSEFEAHRIKRALEKIGLNASILC